MPQDILILMTDQHRPDWVRAPWVRTPNLNGLAAEGVSFTRCITSSPLCMPARVSFLTGMYPHNHGLWDNVGRVQDTGETYLHPLRAAGYRTCHVGKSHLSPHGFGKDLRSEEPYMRSLGYDDVLECTGPLSTQNTKSILTDFFEANGIYELFLDDYRKRREFGWDLAHWPSPLPDGKHADDFIAQTAVDYISRSDPSQPLCLFVGIGGPHNPWDPPARFDTYRSEDMPAALPRDPAPEWLSGPALEHHKRMMGCHLDVTPEQHARSRALYSAKVEHADYCIGRVLEAWYSTRGRDTWVLFWSDHGDMLGDKGRYHKQVFYDPVVRVPAILRPPGGSAPVECGGLVCTTDLTATILDIAGCEPSPNVFGRSVRTALESPEDVGSPIAVSEVANRTMIFDGRWKLLLNSNGDALELFDTESDPTESVNLAGSPPASEVTARLKRELLDFLLRTSYRQHREVNG